MSLFINPGTEPRPGTAHNASLTIARFVEELRPTVVVHRNEPDDSDGYWAYRLVWGDKSIDVDVPGIDPDITAKGEPWVSPRLYVDGSSWLWGYALSAVDEFFTQDQT